MVRCALGHRWQCLFANDFDESKARCYQNFFGDAGELKVLDVGKVKANQIPGIADMVWASFPCQDLSLAGNGAGLSGQRSGTFWPFWGLMEELVEQARSPKLIVLENVCGTLSSHEGRDFVSICRAFSRLGYVFGAIVIDAKLFVPQSRPRLFIVGTRKDREIPSYLVGGGPVALWHPTALVRAAHKLPRDLSHDWVWWTMPAPAPRRTSFADLLEESPTSVSWNSKEDTEKILRMMSELNLKKVKAASRSSRQMVGGVYRRTRHDTRGKPVQRAEVRFDEIAGCLRTPAGGSSRQTILVVRRGEVTSRLLSAREAARLMGLPDDYELPENYNAAYHLAGDGVVVPVVRYLAAQILEPLVVGPTVRALGVRQTRARYKAVREAA